MSFTDEMYKWKRLDQFIRLEKTGSPDDLAKKMQISRRTVFRLINELKEIGSPIYFNKNKNSYCYEYPVNFDIKFEFNAIDNEELNKIIGGYSYNFSHSVTPCHYKDIPLHSEMFYGWNWLIPVCKV